MVQQISEIKNTVVELASNLINRIDSICGCTDERSKYARIVDFMDDLMALSEGVNAIKDYYKDIDLAELLEKLDMLKKAMEESDSFLVDDLMKFELKDLLIYWKEKLRDKK